PLRCDLGGYKDQAELTAALSGDALVVSWDGPDGGQLRTSLGIANGVPVVREIAVGRAGALTALATNLTPEYRVVSGVRRFSEQQADPLHDLGQLTPERMEAEKWYAYRDSPLYVPPPPTEGQRARAQGGGRPAAPSVDVAPTAADIRRGRSS